MGFSRIGQAPNPGIRAPWRKARLIRLLGGFFPLLIGLAAGPVPAQDTFKKENGAPGPFGGAPRQEERPTDPAEDPAREVVDRVVICFDRSAFLKEISRWDGARFWPVLMWDSYLTPRFLEAFKPARVLLAGYGEDPDASIEDGFRAVAAAWGIAPGIAGAKTGADSTALLGGLGDRFPPGAVLVSKGAEESLGGFALAAGRFHLPLVYEVDETPSEVVPFEAVERYRKGIMGMLESLDLPYQGLLDDLDFLTVANGMPFGYAPSGPEMHPAGYAVDDALTRRDSLERWGWSGRLAGGAARSIYMVMCALFLQPREGLFWSRYGADPTNAFGQYDPGDALKAFEAFFPVRAVCHPEATLERWRRLQWPRGNRMGFLYVNSSGGARDWSTSKGQASFFDVPETVPAVVHYTHSGSAGRPFDADSIAGRWLEGGAFIYFGSYAEPYLHAFVPPKVLAGRVAEGAPLGAAFRHPYRKDWIAEREIGKEGEERKVRFNVTAPWKLAYFGDPSYRFLKERPPRVDLEAPRKDYCASVARFRTARPRTEAQRASHELACIAIALVDPKAKQYVDDRSWSRLLRSRPDPERAALFQREMMRAWVAQLRKAGPEALYSAREVKKLARIPDGLRQVTAAGGSSPAAARAFSEFARAYVAGLNEHPESDAGRDKGLAAWVLVTACCFEHSTASAQPFFGWVQEACKELGIDPKTLQKEILERDWIPEAARAAVNTHLKTPDK